MRPKKLVPFLLGSPITIGYTIMDNLVMIVMNYLNGKAGCIQSILIKNYSMMKKAYWIKIF